MILPLENFIGESNGEDVLWSKFKEYLPESYVSFHNYLIGLRRPDVILLVPDKGILIIENKSYLAKNILEVPDKNTIKRRRNPPDYSPYEQARTYIKELSSKVMLPAGLDSVYVLPVVSYPFITEDEFNGTGLNKVSPRVITILKEDLASKEALLGKIQEIFDVAYSSIHHISLVPNGFHQGQVDQVGNLISPNFRNIAQNVYQREALISEKHETDDAIIEYSKLIYSSSGDAFSDESIPALISQWFSGTKLQLYTCDSTAYQRLCNGFEKAIESNGLKPFGFELKNGLSFRLEIGLVCECGEDIELINGIGLNEQLTKLSWLHENSGFNLGQYEMEHAPEKNVIVKAGAGTGKTFSLISRINYLIWQDKITPDRLLNYLVMITFTNESANQMKQALIRNFLQYYQLTKDTIYLALLETVEDVNISTIHSLAKSILAKFSTKLGLGKNFRITSGNYRRNQLLRDNLNCYIATHPEILESRQMSMFYFEKRLVELMEKFDNKNIDLVRDPDIFSFGGGEESLPDGIIEILRKTQEQMDAEAEENNSVYLGDLIRKLRQLLSVLSIEDFPDDRRIKYLFIDEFQDTDDVQIELVSEFRKLLGFKYFVVGDTKQCIYRFRGAEVEAFDRLRVSTPKDDIYELSLSKNYRTDKHLLSLMNDTFRAWDKTGDLNYCGDEILTGTREYSDPDPFHRISFNESAGVNSDNLAKLIKEAMLSAKERDDKVAVLVRYNYQIPQIVEICHQHGLSVETDVGGELFSVDPTIDLHKLLLALRYNTEPDYLFNLYTTSFIKEDMPKIELLEKSKDELVEYFYSMSPIEGWSDYLKLLKTEPVLKVLQEIINKTKPWDTFARKASSVKEEQLQNRLYYMRNLDQLFENLVQIANTDYITINKLTDYLETMILTRQEANAREPFGVASSKTNLICTTVHKSKGLEFDTVILPYCTFDISCARSKGTTDVIYSCPEVGYRITDAKKKQVYVNDVYEKYHKDENASRRKEETRILYVAMTRVKRSLYCFIPNTLGKSVSWAHKLKENYKCES